jgi:hypothetical protein
MHLRTGRFRSGRALELLAGGGPRGSGTGGRLRTAQPHKGCLLCDRDINPRGLNVGDGAKTTEAASEHVSSRCLSSFSE